MRWILLVTNIGLPLRGMIFGMSPLWLAIGVLAHGLMFYAFVAPGCGWLLPVVRRFRTEKKEVWLTIDDGPIPEKTTELALELALRGARATFFVIGNRLAGQPQAATLLMQNGHTLANHSTTHPLATFCGLLPRKLAWEIDICQSHLQRAGAEKNRWFRSPFGIKNLFLLSILRKRNMWMIAWTARAHDGLVCWPETIVPRIANSIKAGDIILMHERRSENIVAILGVVDELQRRGFSFVIPNDTQLIRS